MGQGLIEGPIPSTWLMMTKLRTINLTGHPNFCKDWHRIVSFQIQSYVFLTPYGAVWGLPKRYYGPINFGNKGFQWNITAFNMDGLGWQWYDPSTREAGYTNVIAPDGKCCWDTFSDQFAARNYTLEGPSGTSGPWDYYGLSYERAQLCEWSAPYMPPSAASPPAPPVAPMPPDVPSAPPVPPAAASVTIVSPPRPPLFPQLPGISPMRPYAPPQPLHPPSIPGKWAGAWSWRPNYPFQSPSSPQPQPQPLSTAIVKPPAPQSDTPIECTMYSNQTIFAIPAISTGIFYVAIAVPEASYQYCKFCGCVVEYIALQRGSSSYYRELTEASKQVNSSSGTSAGKTVVGDRVGTDTINDMNAYSNSTPPPASKDSYVLTIISQGFTLSRGELKEVNINSPAPPPRGSGNDGSSSELQRTGPGLGGAWSLDPGVNGDYLFKIQVGGNVWYRWVLVDVDPPFVSGSLLVLNKKATFEGSTTTDMGKGRWQYLLVVLNMSEPVRNFNLMEALQLNDSTLIRIDCFESLDTASIKVASTSYKMVESVGLPEASQSSISASQETPLSDYYIAATYGRHYVRSCLAVLYAADDSKPSITLPRGAVVDLTGNPSVTSLFLQANLKDSLSASADRLAGVTSALVGGILASTAAIATSAACISSVPSHSSLLQSAYHIQMLAMSVNLASRGISEMYEGLPEVLRWSLMGIQGHLPALDRMFSSNASTNTTDSVSKVLGLDMNSLPPSPPASLAVPSHNRSRLLLADVNASLGGLPPKPTLPPQLLITQQSQQLPAMVQQTPTADPYPPSSPLDLMAVTQNVLIEWLQTMMAFNMLASSSNHSEESNTQQQGSNSTQQQEVSRVSKNGSESSGLNSYVIVGGGADSINDVSIDADGRVMNVSWIAPAEESPTTSSINTSATHERATQRLTSTLANAGLVIGSVLIVHLILILLYNRFVGGELNPILEFPRVEVDTAGLILVALTFYSCCTFGAFDKLWQTDQITAVAVLLLLVLPYLLLLWWITVCRWYLEETPPGDRCGARHHCEAEGQQQQQQTGPGNIVVASGTVRVPDQEVKDAEGYEGHRRTARLGPQWPLIHEVNAFSTAGTPNLSNSTTPKGREAQVPARAPTALRFGQNSHFLLKIFKGSKFKNQGVQSPHQQPAVLSQGVQQQQQAAVQASTVDGSDGPGYRPCRTSSISSRQKPAAVMNDQGPSSMDGQKLLAPVAESVLRGQENAVSRTGSLIFGHKFRMGDVSTVVPEARQLTTRELSVTNKIAGRHLSFSEGNYRAFVQQEQDAMNSSSAFLRLRQHSLVRPSEIAPLVQQPQQGHSSRLSVPSNCTRSLRPSLRKQVNFDADEHMDGDGNSFHLPKRPIIPTRRNLNRPDDDERGSLSNQRKDNADAQDECCDPTEIEDYDDDEPGTQLRFSPLRFVHFDIRPPLPHGTANGLSAAPSPSSASIIKGRDAPAWNLESVKGIRSSRSTTLESRELKPAIWKAAEPHELALSPTTQLQDPVPDEQQQQFSIQLPAAAGALRKERAEEGKAAGPAGKSPLNRGLRILSNPKQSYPDLATDGEDSRNHHSWRPRPTSFLRPTMSSQVDVSRLRSFSGITSTHASVKSLPIATIEALESMQLGFKVQLPADNDSLGQQLSRGNRRSVLTPAAGPMAEAIEVEKQNGETPAIGSDDPCFLLKAPRHKISASPSDQDEVPSTSHPRRPSFNNSRARPISQFKKFTHFVTAVVRTPGMPVMVLDAPATSSGILPSLDQANFGMYALTPGVMLGEHIVAGTDRCKNPDMVSDQACATRDKSKDHRNTNSSGNAIGDMLWWPAVAQQEMDASHARPVCESLETPAASRLREDSFMLGNQPATVDKRLLALYPGKMVPMYLMRYNPDCWPLRLCIAPPIYLLARFEFMFEDAISRFNAGSTRFGRYRIHSPTQQCRRSTWSMGGMQLGRETKMIMSINAANVTHKIFCAAAFGLLGVYTRSVLQIVLLIVLQSAITLQLLAWRPYINRAQLLSETVCHMGVMGLFLCAAALLNREPDNHASTTWIMIGCFFLTAGSVIGYTMYTLWKSIQSITTKVLKWLKDRLGGVRQPSLTLNGLAIDNMADDNNYNRQDSSIIENAGEQISAQRSKPMTLSYVSHAWSPAEGPNASVELPSLSRVMMFQTRRSSDCDEGGRRDSRPISGVLAGGRDAGGGSGVLGGGRDAGSGSGVLAGGRDGGVSVVRTAEDEIQGRSESSSGRNNTELMRQKTGSHRRPRSSIVTS
ncbi:hypothetical protein VaNZ11_001709 [Volvox africanus]|uniref:Uncharacterized protein n=1 Tax=Volvox africanus TaxID=51714 RepID=A0ABQ5RQC3_9CHLO|nr:hypothetical protein VaNZ11_001709 [Volvox africanus]